MIDLIRLNGNLANTDDDQALIDSTLKALDDRYHLSQKILKEPGLADIINQLMGRIQRAYGALGRVKNRRIVDIASGSNSSKAPSFAFVDRPLGEQPIPIPGPQGYSALFEPWFCRILAELGADAVGIDLGDLDGEPFEHYRVDLGEPGSLNFLPEHSFDAVQDSRLFGSPEFTAAFPERAGRLKVAAEICRQEQRLLKPKGIVIHSDAADILE